MLRPLFGNGRDRLFVFRIGYREHRVAVCSLEIPLAVNVSTNVSWRARRDDGEHAGR